MKAISTNFIDPHRKEMTIANGPFSVHVSGGLTVLTFTQLNQSVEGLAGGMEMRNSDAMVVSRVAIPSELIPSMMNMMGRIFSASKQRAGTG